MRKYPLSAFVNVAAAGPYTYGKGEGSHEPRMIRYNSLSFATHILLYAAS